MKFLPAGGPSFKEKRPRVSKAGVRVNARGERLRIVITTISGNRDRERVQQILQEQWM